MKKINKISKILHKDKEMIKNTYQVKNAEKFEN
jgi:hypothetical protein